MNLPTVPIFWERLELSRLLGAESWRAAREQLADSQDVRQVCQQLVIRHFLTRWQCKELLLDRKQFYLAKYRLLDQLGQGGMGMVFKAEHLTTQRVVALKVVAKRGLETPNGLARFRREVQVIAALNHPHIITAVDADCDDEHGQHFLVMEYVEGHDLNYWLQHEHPLPIDWVCECIRQTAIGLQHACERGMVHRDIKPSNLLVVAEDVHSPPLVKILDMGMARYSELDEDDEITATGQILGTPDYIAPEQAEDTTGADIRSDIFSLGCTLFKVLTGKVPFQGRNSMEKLMARAKRDAPPVTAFREDVPAGVERVVAKMLARDLEARYQTPAEVAEALHPFSEFAPRPRPTAAKRRPTIDPDHPQAQFLAFLDHIDRDAQAEREAAREQGGLGLFRRSYTAPEGPTERPSSRAEGATHRKTYVAPEPAGTGPRGDAFAHRKTYVPPDQSASTPPAGRIDGGAHRKTFVQPEPPLLPPIAVGPQAPPPVSRSAGVVPRGEPGSGEKAASGEKPAPLPEGSPLASDQDSFDSVVEGDPSQTPVVGSPKERPGVSGSYGGAARPLSAGPAGRGPGSGDSNEIPPVLEDVHQPKPYVVEGDSHILTGMPSGLEIPRLEGDASSVGPDESSVASAKAHFALQAAVALLDPRPIDPEASTQVRLAALAPDGLPPTTKSDSAAKGPANGVAGVKSGGARGAASGSKGPRPALPARPGGSKGNTASALDRPAPTKPPASDGSSIRKFLWADRSSMKAQYRPKPRFPWTWVLAAGSVLPILVFGYLFFSSSGGGRPTEKSAAGGANSLAGERRPANANSNVQYFEWTGIPVGSRHLLTFTPKTAGEFHVQLEVLDSEPGLVVTTYLNDRLAAPGRYVDEAFLKAKQPIQLGSHLFTTVEQVVRVEAELPSLRASGVDYGAWYSAGPFHPASDSKKNSLDSHLEAENRFDLSDSFRGAKGQPVKWTKAVLAEADENDLERLWGKDADQLPAFGLLSRVLTAQKAGSVRMFFGSQAPMVISLNDKPVFIQPHGLRALEPYDKLVRLELKEGKNILRVKFLLQKDHAKFFFADRTPPHSTWDTPLKFAVSLHPIGPASPSPEDK